MVAIKERLKCQNCGGLLEDAGDSDDKDGHRIVCIICNREHDAKGELLDHPVGSNTAERADGRHNENFGARLR